MSSADAGKGARSGISSRGFHAREMIDPTPTELASVETGLCTTSEPAKHGVLQRPENHRDKLGGVCDNLFRARNPDQQFAFLLKVV